MVEVPILLSCNKGVQSVEDISDSPPVQSRPAVSHFGTALPAFSEEENKHTAFQPIFTAKI